MKKPYWKILLELWETRTWISNEDFRRATHGSPKLTSRISDMRAKGVEIVSARRGNYFVYALLTPPEEVEKIMRGRRRKAA